MEIIELEKLSSARLKKYQQWDWSREILDGCPNYVFTASAAMTGHSLRRHFPEMTLVLAYFERGQMHYCHPDYELAAIVKKVIVKTQKNLDYLDGIYQEWKKAKAESEKLFYDIKTTNLISLSDEKLLELYDQFIEHFIANLGSAFFIEAFVVSKRKVTEEGFRRFLALQGKTDLFSKYYGLLTLPAEPTFLNRFAAELKKAAESPKKLQLIKKIQQKYSWIRASYGFYEPVDQEYIDKELKYLGKSGSGDHFRKLVANLTARKARIIKELKVPLVIQNQLKLMTHLTFWQDERKEMCSRSVEICSIFLDEFFRRLNIKKKHLKWMFPIEIREVFTQGIDLDKIKKRRKGCLYIQKNGNYELLAGLESKKVIAELFPADLDRDIKELSGLAASPGKVRGEVKVLLSSRQESKMNQGDILVAGMTRPDYMPLIRKAGAIVTDEGGITCHAAIVARELGIPCIVGTKGATSILKDGNEVEVDGDRGMVKIIKKA